MIVAPSNPKKKSGNLEEMGFAILTRISYAFLSMINNNVTGSRNIMPPVSVVRRNFIIDFILIVLNAVLILL